MKTRRLHPRADRSRAMLSLRSMPNVGPATEGDLLRLGIRRPADLAGMDADDLYERLCAEDGVRHDPCARDVFAAAIDYAEGAPARPWWSYTPERKARDARTAARARRTDSPARRAR